MHKRFQERGGHVPDTFLAQLGRSELLQALHRTELWDSDDDGAISEDEIPQLYQISFGPGQPQFRGVQIPRLSGPTTNVARHSNLQIPKWFSKLDRNGDGELTRREFPGSRSEFPQLDQDSNGVLSTVEAEFVK